MRHQPNQRKGPLSLLVCPECPQGHGDWPRRERLAPGVVLDIQLRQQPQLPQQHHRLERQYHQPQQRLARPAAQHHHRRRHAAGAHGDLYLGRDLSRPDADRRARPHHHFHLCQPPAHHHDAEGQVTRIASRAWPHLAYTYDAAHRLVRGGGAFDERIDSPLDAMGGRTLEQIHTSGGAALAKTQSRVFDALGRLLQSIGAASQTTSYAYDNMDNLSSITDPLSNVTGQSFDALNRLIQMAAPLSSTSVYGYDAHDNRTSVTDPRGLVTSYVYDGLDNLIQVSSPDTGATAYVVDDAGNRVQQTDPAGVVVQMSYDALYRITAKTYAADPTENVTYRYDEAAAGFGIGRLTSVTDSSGGTSYVYDARGNVVQETHVVGGQSYVTAYGYDLANHFGPGIYPPRPIVRLTRDAVGP